MDPFFVIAESVESSDINGGHRATNDKRACRTHVIFLLCRTVFFKKKSQGVTYEHTFYSTARSKHFGPGFDLVNKSTTCTLWGLIPRTVRCLFHY